MADVPEPDTRPAIFDRSQIVAGILPDPLPLVGLGGGSGRAPEDEVQTALLSPAPDRSMDQLLAIDAGRESDKVDQAGSAFALALAARQQPFAGELYTIGEPLDQPAGPTETATPAIPIPTPRPARPSDGVAVEEVAMAAATQAAPAAAPSPEQTVDAGASIATVAVAETLSGTEETSTPDVAEVEMAALPPQDEPEIAAREQAPAAQSAPAGEPSGADETNGAATSVPAEAAVPPDERDMARQDAVLSAGLAPAADTKIEVAQAELAAGANLSIPCARYIGQPMTRCEAEVVRSGEGDADVTIFWPDGGKRILQFRAGKPEGANTLQEFRFTREADLNMIRVGAGERFEVLDAIPLGQ